MENLKIVRWFSGVTKNKIFQFPQPFMGFVKDKVISLEF